MKNKIFVAFILVNLTGICIGFVANSLNSTPPLNTKVKDVYFTRVEYPQSKIYQGMNVWNFNATFTVHNVNRTADSQGRASFFLKFYRDGEVSFDEYNDTIYKVWECNKGSMVRRCYIPSIPIWRGPNTYDYKIELYWYYEGTSYLQDTTTFSVTCVLRDPHFHTFAYLSVYSFITIMLIIYFWATRLPEFWEYREK